MTEPNELRSRFRGAFLGCMLGDAFGSALEASTARDAGTQSSVAARAASTGPWSYTDDTQMQIGVAESLIERGRLDEEHLLRKLAEECDPALGYGHGTRAVFASLRRGTHWRRAAYALWPEGSMGNGAAVRVAPIACLCHDDPVLLGYAAQSSAMVTHGHSIARLGALLHAHAIADALHAPTGVALDGPRFIARTLRVLPTGERVFTSKLNAAASLLDRDAPVDEVVAMLGNGVTADQSVPLALYAFARWSREFEAVVTNTARCGGDVDTIAAMSGALAGAFLSEDGLPSAWISNLENGAKGRDHVVHLADGILELSSRMAASRR